MANINLLPWRERERGERKQQFLINLGIAAGIAFLILLAVDRFIVSKIDNQNGRNVYLAQQIEILDKELAEIRQLQQQKKDLSERMAVIQNLQGMRPVIVRLFDELVRTLPDGVYYDTITTTEQSISIEGVAESNSRVSALMRALDDSEWFADPNLRQVSAVSGATNAAGGQDTGRNRFQLMVSITTPAGETEEAAQ
jgi:type IV pilus assembly protein PilN